jgi:uncharacterized membrane protein
MLSVLLEDDDEGVLISDRFFGLIVLGIALVFVGIAILVVASLSQGGSGSVGVVIFIGPFPIVFGSGPNSIWLILIGITLGVLSLVLFLIINRRYRSKRI